MNAALLKDPGKVSATLTLSNVRSAVVDGGGRTRVADLRVRLSRPGLGRDGNWAYVLGWQGGGRHAADLVRGPDGTLRSSRPVPIGGDWKSFIRVHKGRTQISAPIRMPADPAVGFAGFPAVAKVTRPMVRDTQLLQIERKDDGPLWAWTGEVRRCHRPASPRARSLGDRRRERGGVMSTLVLAHIGHWTTSLAFFGPVVLLPLGLYAAAVMERRRS